MGIDTPDYSSAIVDLKNSCGTRFLEVKVAIGTRENLGRPTKTPIENKLDLMKFLNH